MIARAQRAFPPASGAWPVPERHPSLDAGEVHVWLARAGAQSVCEAAFFASLDVAERERAARFHFARDRRRFVVAHGLLRRLLARYTALCARALAFGTGPFGKPHLLARENLVNLDFSLSHSGDLILIAVAQSRAVGVDVERRDDAVEHDDLAAFCFSQAERAALRAVPSSERAAAFFAAWTRKEAYIKATGFGITHGLDHFDVTLTAGDARLLCDRTEPGAAERWNAHDLAVDDGYSGAVIADGPAYRLRCFSMPHPGEGVGA